jgi:sRNA-binding protein
MGHSSDRSGAVQASGRGAARYFSGLASPQSSPRVLLTGCAVSCRQLEKVERRYARKRAKLEAERLAAEERARQEARRRKVAHAESELLVSLHLGGFAVLAARSSQRRQPSTVEVAAPS